MSAWRSCVVLAVVLGAAAACSDDDEAAPKTNLVVGPTRSTSPPLAFPAPSQLPAPNLVFGRVTAPFGFCPNVQFIVGQVIVVTTPSTRFFGGITCVDLVVGRAVNVQGQRRSDGKVAAMIIEPPR